MAYTGGMASELMSFDEVQNYLGQVADGLPEDLFRELNGGVVLLPDIAPSPDGEDLFTLGRYHYDPRGLGRYITIYYGSFVQVFRDASPQRQKRELDRLLRHELTHHIESLAGVRDLEEKDRRFLENYKTKRQRHRKT